MLSDLHAASASTLHQAYRQGTVSPLEVAQATIAHLQRWEPHLCATWAFDAEATLEMARASAARWHQKAPLSALDGVPVTIKENIATRGQAVPLGTAATELLAAAEDAPPAARLREAGAVFLAKTTMPDFGMLTSGLSSFHALTRNPWNLQDNPGGSSAGAGAAAAAGYGPLHLGTDIGGSIRLPASLCGVVGFKPSNGRVPIKPPFAGRVAGPMTRSVQDAAWMMATLSQPDWRDGTSLPPQQLDWTDLGEDPHATLRGLKLGLLMDAGWGLPVAPEVARQVLAAAELLASAGAQVQPMAPFTPREMPDGINSFWRFRSWHDISQLPPQRQALVLPFIRAWVAEAAGYDAATVFRGFMQMAALRDAAVAACQPFDYVLSPVCPVSAFPATHAMPSNDPLQAMEHIAFTLPFNMSEQPAISVPCAGARLPAATMSTGLPAPRVGLQIVGRRHDDLGVLRVARAFEMLRGAGPAWPEPPAVATASR